MPQTFSQTVSKHEEINEGSLLDAHIIILYMDIVFNKRKPEVMKTVNRSKIFPDIKSHELGMVKPYTIHTP